MQRYTSTTENTMVKISMPPTVTIRTGVKFQPSLELQVDWSTMSDHGRLIHFKVFGHCRQQEKDQITNRSKSILESKKGRLSCTQIMASDYLFRSFYAVLYDIHGLTFHILRSRSL